MKCIQSDSLLLGTQRLLLEPLRKIHALELWELLSDPKIYQFLASDPPLTLEVLKDRFERLEDGNSQNSDEVCLNWILRIRSTKQSIGRIQSTVRTGSSAFLAYELGVPYWGQGFAKEACLRVIQFLQNDYQVPQIFANVDTRNSASIQLLQRLGFQLFSYTEKVDYFKGNSSDEYRYKLTDLDSSEVG